MQLKALFIYFVISFVNEMVSNFPEYLNLPTDDQLSLHFYTICEALIIFYIYYKEFKFKNPYPMLALGAAFTIIALSRVSRTEYNAFTNTIEAILVLPFTITFFFKISNDLSIPKLTDYYFFWINSAFLFYFSFSFLIFLFAQYIMNVSYFYVWNIHLIANITYNLLLAIGIWKTRTYRH
jgi:hypothetical protein